MTQRPDLDPWQFRVSRDEADINAPDAAQVGTMALRTGPAIKCAQVLDRGGSPVGRVVGFPIDLVGKKLVDDLLQLDIDASGDADTFADRALRRIGGRFVFILDALGALRIYTDSGAQVPCVWDTETGAVGSTAHAILADPDYSARINQPRWEHLKIAQSGWFPGGLTAHDGIERLLPNHYLDLDTMQAHRCWPWSVFPSTDAPEQAVAEIIEKVRDQMQAFVGAPRKIAQALTAGHETRMFLGMSRPFQQDLEYVTVVGNDSHAVDSFIARKLAREFGLKHRELPRVTSDEPARAQFVRRGGHCIAESGSHYFPSVHPIAETHLFVGGSGGELGRAFLWRDSDTPDTEITASLLMARFGLPSEPEVVARLTAWLDEVNRSNAFEILDLAYMEQRMGPWGSAQFCNDPTLVRYAPLVTRDITERMLALPPDWKRNEGLSREIVRQTWPEIGRIPFNSAGTARDFVAKVQRVVDDPSLIVRAIRKRFL